ncbi:Chs5p-Arf1p-binding proteins-domain-containing protein [Coprinopsis sp. MPI-PUGE-AT-0042]|nr:Chs5p-Arf1p-binding proteins-domain-containing protein [Coprinopsis sp. MPI-PUGE-AT-0042]
MFNFNGRDAHCTLPVSKIHLPFHKSIGKTLPERVKTEDDDVYSSHADPTLRPLPAPGLRGTRSRAYALLTRLVFSLGWDKFLKTRSSVFVMEEECRMQKAQTDVVKSAGVNPNGYGMIHPTVTQAEPSSTKMGLFTIPRTIEFRLGA